MTGADLTAAAALAAGLPYHGSLATDGPLRLLYLAAALAILFVLPGVVLLGVLDAGLNLRRRWLPPRGA